MCYIYSPFFECAHIGRKQATVSCTSAVAAGQTCSTLSRDVNELFRGRCETCFETFGPLKPGQSARDPAACEILQQIFGRNPKARPLFWYRDFAPSLWPERDVGHLATRPELQTARRGARRDHGDEDDDATIAAMLESAMRDDTTVRGNVIPELIERAFRRREANARKGESSGNAQEAKESPAVRQALKQENDGD